MGKWISDRNMHISADYWDAQFFSVFTKLKSSLIYFIISISVLRDYETEKTTGEPAPASLEPMIISFHLSKAGQFYDKAISFSNYEFEMAKFCSLKHLTALGLKLIEKAVPGSKLFRNFDLVLEFIKNTSILYFIYQFWNIYNFV